MKVSVSSYSFQKLLQNGTLNQVELIGKAKEIGFDGVEFAGLMPHNGMSAFEYAKLLRAESEKQQMPITSYTIGSDFLTGSGGDIAKEIQRVKGEVDIAEQLGVPVMRHDATGGFAPGTREWRGFDDVLAQIADAYREITAYAQTKGIKTTVENHGYFAQDSDRVEKLINKVAHPNFGWLCDIGNFVCVDENPVFAVGRAAPYTFYAHAKDFHIKSGMAPNPGSGFFKSRGGNYLRGAIIGHGDVPVQQCLGILKNAGYNGFVALEFEGMEDNYTALEIGLANLRRYIAAL